MIDQNDRDLVVRFVDDLTDYAIVILDLHGKILTWNAGARALLGYAPGEIVGRNFTELYTKLDLMSGMSGSSLKDALQWGRHEATGLLVGKDSKKVQARVILRPLTDAAQKLVGFGMLAQEVEGVPKAKSPARVDSQASKVVALRAGAKILVVDDNAGILDEAVETLKGMGYGVVSASSGAEALAMLERHDDIDLLFTDVVMPGEIAGRALADKAMRLRPGLKVLFASGYFEGALVSKGELETDVRFIAKPYRMKELALKIDEVLKSVS